MKAWPPVAALLYLQTATAEEFYGLWAGGVNVRDGLYEGQSTETRIAPFIFGGYGDLSIEANRAAYSVYRDGTWFASVAGQYRTYLSLSNSDARDLGIDERKPAIEAGAAIGRRLGGGFVTRMTALHDVSDIHNGWELDWQLYRHDDIGPIRLLSSAGLQYQSSDLAKYYFSTPDYDLSESYSAEVEFIATYARGHAGYFLGTRSYLFSDDVNDSPIVDQPYVIQVFAGIGYQF